MSDDVIGAFGEDHATALTGVTRKQLRHWDRIGLLRPSYGSGATGLPYGRVYSFRDLVSLRVLGQLRNEHRIPVAYLQKVLEELSKLSDEPWASKTLQVLGKTVVIAESGSGRRHEIVRGQQVLDVPLKVVITGMKQAVARLNERREGEVGKVVHGKFVAENQPVIAGTRIPVAAIKSFAAGGYDVARILREYPDLTAADVEAAIAYEGNSAAA